MSRALVLVCLMAAAARAQPTRSPVDGALPGPGGTVSERSRVEVRPAGRPLARISVENLLGDVRVEGHDGATVTIEARKRAPDEAALDRLRVSLVPSSDGSVRIATAADRDEGRTIARGEVAIDLVIRAPHQARVDAIVGNGTLELFDMDDGGELESAAGKIAVRNVQGDLYTHSVSGSLSLSQVFGSLDASTIASDVDLDGIGGAKVIATASRGRIASRRVRARDVELTSTSGDILLEAEAALRGRLVVASMRGNVDVRLRRAGALVVRGRGARIELGAGARLEPSGWVQVTHGRGADAALVELRSQLGVVRFSIVQ